MVEKLRNAQHELTQVKRGLAATPNESALTVVVERLKSASHEMAGYDQRLRRIDKKIAAAQYEHDEIEKKLRRLQRKVIDEQIQQEEDGRIARQVIRTQDTMREFLSRATARKIDRLSGFVTESFRFLLRKKHLVDHVSIDPQNFQITLFDREGRHVPKQRLSEGEKQIFAVSVLWGLSRASTRPLPAIIDTPMARLDAEHRNQLVSRYFPNASHQVLILSTDTEIERKYFEDLQPHIARAYHLAYDESSKVTVVEEGYFWEADAGCLEEVAV